MALQTVCWHCPAQPLLALPSSAFRRVETALAAALKGSTNAGALAQLGAFRSGVAERLEGLLQALDDSEAAFRCTGCKLSPACHSPGLKVRLHCTACLSSTGRLTLFLFCRLPTLCCRHLGSFINAQKATLADPKAFFGVLHAFAQELAGAHQENAAADVAARQSVGQGTVRAGPVSHNTLRLAQNPAAAMLPHFAVQCAHPCFSLCVCRMASHAGRAKRAAPQAAHLPAWACPNGDGRAAQAAGRVMPARQDARQSSRSRR